MIIQIIFTFMCAGLFMVGVLGIPLIWDDDDAWSRLAALSMGILLIVPILLIVLVWTS